MVNHEGRPTLEAVDVPGRYLETVPLEVEWVAGRALLGVFGNRFEEQWTLQVLNLTDEYPRPVGEEMSHEIGELWIEADPHPFDSSDSYDYAHGIVREWFAARELLVREETPGVQLCGAILCSTYAILKS